ncbi:MAG: hypothetical protein GX155_09715 [Smithella sp.]|nr:hypothetical protein [Smithella sp.]
MKNAWLKSSVLFALMLIAGCGLKGNPVSPRPALSAHPPKQVLNVSADEKTARLSWRLENTAVNVSFISIEKSTLGSHGNVCRDCPRTYETIGRVMAAGRQGENNEYTYFDADVEKGHVYTYRLKFCDARGACLESQGAELDYQ